MITILLIVPRFIIYNSLFSTSSGSGRPKVSRNTILFTRTQAERERIITEKIAIILVDSDGPVDVGPEMKLCSRDLKSSFLRNHRDVVCLLLFS